MYSIARTSSFFVATDEHYLYLLIEVHLLNDYRIFAILPDFQSPILPVLQLVL
jgi:hypothetical protein